MYNDDERLLAEMTQILDAMSPFQTADRVQKESSHNIYKESQIEMATAELFQEGSSHNKESETEAEETPIKKNSYVKYFYMLLIALAIIPATIRAGTLFRAPTKPPVFVSSVAHHYAYQQPEGGLRFSSHNYVPKLQSTPLISSQR